MLVYVSVQDESELSSCLLLKHHGGGMLPPQTNSASKHSSAEGSGLASMAWEILLHSSLPRTPTTDCSKEWGTMSITCFTTSSLTSPVTATVSDHVDIILYLLQKLMTEILWIDNFSETYIDGSSALLTLTVSLVFAYTDYCFYIFYVIPSRYVRL